ncbi:hypothetical protein PCASD_14797 [Puccinia coronata f. sp. avenae]|uniref:Retrotransposon gag domain-containing protein n=1 Tax=Puccinia coronata f. sp. avenae TaxID=200324 RepID=A0A2N5TBT6_9BASI|nr:hypothetical protein PCASD_14797 [Puccinia coronata f. sp. avenae]
MSHWFAARKPLPPSPPSASLSRTPIVPSLPIRRAPRPRPIPPAASMSFGPPTDNLTGPSGSNPSQSARIDQLSADMARVQESMARMMKFLEESSFTTCPHPPSHHDPADANHERQHPPHSSHHFAPDPTFHGPTGPEFAHIARLETLKIQDLWFAGDSGQLGPFLRNIRDFLCPRSSLFQSETRRVVWVSRHFGYWPSEHRKTPLPTENWYNSLLLDNARQQGVFDQYADLDGIPFILPTLASVEALLGGLIAIFGDKFSKENAKQALAACQQRNLTIGKYNAQFSSLVYLVDDVEENRIEKYVLGLNPWIIRKAMNKDWISAKTLSEKMVLATEVAAQLDILSQLPPDIPLNHHPSSTQRHHVLQFPHPQPLPQPRDPDAMEVDALTTAAQQQASLMDATRLICRARKLCF